MTDHEISGSASPAGLEQEQSRLLRKALQHSGLRHGDLWLRYFSIGGTVGEYEVDAYIQSLFSLPAGQRRQLVDEFICLSLIHI